MPVRSILLSLAVLPALLVSSHAVSAATVNKCTGKNGAVTYQDAPCAQGAETKAVDVEAPVREGKRNGGAKTRRPSASGEGEVIILPPKRPKPEPDGGAAARSKG